MKKLILALILYPLSFCLWGEAWGVVAHESSTESHTGTTGSTSQASFDITVPFTASTRGLLVFTYNANSNAFDATSVKINPAGANIDVPYVPDSNANDTVGEPGSCGAWFLGQGLPTSSGTVRINRNNNANIMYAVAITVTGSANIFAGPTVQQESDGAMSEVAVSSTVTALRYACGYTGAVGPPTAGANSTLLQSIAFGAYSAAAARETTAGSGSRSAGLVAASDDRAQSVLALAEIPACTGSVWTSTGVKGETIGITEPATLYLNGLSSGSLIVVGSRTYDASNTTSTAISDSLNGSYTNVFTSAISVSGVASLHRFANNQAGSITITATGDGPSTSITLYAHEFCTAAIPATPESGTAVTNPLGASGTATAGPMTPGDDNALLVAVMGAHVAPGAVTENAGGEGFTLSNEDETQISSMTYKIISGAPSSQSESWTISSGGWGAGIAAFKPVVTAAPATNPGILRRRIQ